MKIKFNILIIFIFCIANCLNAQDARQLYIQAKLAYEEGNIAVCISRLNYAAEMLGGTNVRIESLRAQAYFASNDFVNASVAIKNYFNLLPTITSDNESLEKMKELAQEISKGLESTEVKFHEKIEKKHADNLKKVEDDIEKAASNKRNELETINETNSHNNFELALKSKDKNLLEFVKENANLDSDNYKLIEEEIDKYNNPNKYIVNAVKNKNLDEVSYLLKLGANVDLAVGDDLGLTHIAVLNADLRMVKLLIENKANLELKNRKGESPLLMGIREKVDYYTLLELIESGADIKTKNYREESAFAISLQFDYPKMARILLSKGIDINEYITINSEKYTPLYFVVRYLNNSSLVSDFIKNGAHLNTKGYKDWTPLMAAIYSNKLDIALHLIANDADPNIEGPNGWTALHFAARENQLDITKALLSKGANKNAKDIWNRTPIDVAREHEHKELKKTIKKY